jgi:hypothetical protein
MFSLSFVKSLPIRVLLICRVSTHMKKVDVIENFIGRLFVDFPIKNQSTPGIEIKLMFYF